jgi:hypothetical protein
MSIKLEEFLSELIDRVRNNDLSHDDTKSLTDLFLSNELKKAGKTTKMIYDEKDMRYYTMGWYVYNSLSKKD